MWNPLKWRRVTENRIAVLEERLAKQIEPDLKFTGDSVAETANRLTATEQRFSDSLAEVERRLSDNNDIRARLTDLRRIVNPYSQPNINALWDVAKDITPAHLILKSLGQDLAERLRSALPARTGLQPQHVGIKSKATTQADLESDWAAYWLSEYKIPLIFHRKLWEVCFLNQALYEHGMINPGRRGLGFGCGVESFPSYFASRGVYVVVTDAPPDHAQTAGWTKGTQYASNLETLHKRELVSHDEFDKHVTHRFVDMNAIPPDLRDFDFCWSICALEHLGSIAKGLDFIENSLETLRPGGVAVHTTEFNFLDDEDTVDNWVTVYYQRKHFVDLRNRLEANGHKIAPLDFDVGNSILDKFIDLPPFRQNAKTETELSWLKNEPHLKVSSDGFVVTCFGLVITKAQ